MNKNVLKACFFLCLLSYFAPSYAVTYTFTTDGDWTVASNWDMGMYPGTTIGVDDEVVIDGDCTIPAGVTITIDGTLTIKVALINEGTLDNNGITSIPTLAILDNKGTIDNSGDIKVENDLDNAGDLNNEGGGVIENNGEITMGATSDFVNKGSATLNNGTTGTGIIMTSMGTFTNEAGGVINNNAGSKMELGGTDFDNAGDFNNSASSELKLATDFTTSTNTATGKIVNKGVMTLLEGDLFSNLGILINETGGTLELEDVLDNDGDLINKGSLKVGIMAMDKGKVVNDDDFNNFATLTIGSDNSLENGGSGTFVNESGGTIDNNGTILNENDMSNIGTLNNNAGGEVDNDLGDMMDNEGTWNNKTGSKFTNDGTFANKVGATFTDNGSIVNGGSSSFMNEGTLKGMGSITQTGTVLENAGILAPGESPGIFSITGDYTENGTFAVEIQGTTPGTDYDRLDVSGTATLTSGTISVTFTGSFSPAVGQSFTVIDADTRVGEFATETLPTLTGDRIVDVVYEGSNVRVRILSALPVELTSFQAWQENDKAVNLRWETASESNNQGFEIQRSSDAKNWKKLAFAQGHDNTTETKTYNYIDTKPFQGFNYYRLKQIDFDGQYELSKVVSIALNEIEPSTIFNVTPNYAEGKLNVFIQSSPNSDGSIFLYSANSQLIAQKSFEAIDDRSIQSFDIQGLSHGTYYVQLVSKQVNLTKAVFIR